MSRVAFLSVVLLVLLAASHGAAAEPVAIPVGDLILVRTASAERWYLAEHTGDKRNVLVITVSATGGVEMSTIPLPDATGEPDDPDDPPPPEKTLAELVDGWADAVNDPTTRAQLAAVYQFSLQAIDSESITSVSTLKAFQAQADTVVLGGQAEKWTPFLVKLKDHLDAHVADDLAAYRSAWAEIVSGLSQDVDSAVLEYLLNAHASEWGQP